MRLTGGMGLHRAFEIFDAQGPIVYPPPGIISYSKVPYVQVSLVPTHLQVLFPFLLPLMTLRPPTSSPPELCPIEQ